MAKNFSKKSDHSESNVKVSFLYKCFLKVRNFCRNCFNLEDGSNFVTSDINTVIVEDQSGVGASEFGGHLRVEISKKKLNFKKKIKISKKKIKFTKKNG